jgi:nucleotide sugar dehydrogenase
LKNISQLYSQAFDTIIPVSRPEVAEMTKLYENCQRMMCIAYANEMADACIPHGIDPFEICSAASTKPFGYTPFTPSLGIGGHCIPINPYYLLSNSTFPLLQAATERMSQRPSVIAQRTLDTLSVVSTRNSMSNGIHPRPRVLIVGVGFKRGQSVLSNSPGLALAMNLLQSGKVGVYYADSLVAQCQVPQIPRLRDEDWRKETLETFNLIIVAFYQVGMDFKVLKELHGVKVERWCC